MFSTEGSDDPSVLAFDRLAGNVTLLGVMLRLVVVISSSVMKRILMAVEPWQVVVPGGDSSETA